MLALQICSGILVVTAALCVIGSVLAKRRDRRFLAYADKLAKEASAKRSLSQV